MKLSVVASSMDYETLRQLFLNEDLSYEEIALKWYEIQKNSFDRFGGKE